MDDDSFGHLIAEWGISHAHAKKWLPIPTITQKSDFRSRHFNGMMESIACGAAMGLTYSIEKELTTVIAEGSFSVGQLHATFSKIRSEFDGSTPLKILIVDRGSEFEPSQEEVRELVKGWGVIFHNVPVRIALLVEEELHYGLGRMASVYAEQHDVPLDVFRHSLDALHWLSKDAPAQSSC